MKTKPRSIIRKRRRSPSRSVPSHQPANRIPPKWRWHYRVLESLRDHLLDDRAVALANAAEPIERHSMDPADSATDEFDHALAATLLTGEHNALYELEAARRRILAGTYGICEKTGKHIPPERLRAVPWTRFTKDAEVALEKAGEIRPVGLAPAATIQGPESGALGQAEEPEKEELQARVVRRHQLAENLEAIGQGGRAEPAMEKRSNGASDEAPAPIGKTTRRKAHAHAKPAKRRKTASRRTCGGRRN